MEAFRNLAQVFSGNRLELIRSYRVDLDKDLGRLFNRMHKAEGQIE